jgi:hypothetical protein
MPAADDHARDETERRLKLFAWADGVLNGLGLTGRVAQADLDELSRISLDLESAEAILAIRDALHPTGGAKAAEHFAGLTERALRQILKSRFAELRKERAAALRNQGAGSQPTSQSSVNPADLIRYGVLEKYVELSSHQATAVTLWIIHTHTYDLFVVSPRLALISPVRGCGKTTLLDLVEQLAHRGKRTDSITAAAIYHLVDSEHACLLLDEADNLDTAADKLLKAVLNGGHRRGAKRINMTRDGFREFDIFAPMALAALGTLPLPLMHRSVVIEMRRASRGLKRFDARDPATMQDLLTIHREIAQWASTARLGSDPSLPAMLRNRPADNWRPLIAIADAIGDEWPELAREAAVTLSRSRPDEDPGVTLLSNIREIFERRRIDRLPSAVMVEDLVAIEDGMWFEWRGVKDDRQPRQLSQGELAKLLTPFGIRPRTVWLVPRNSGSRSGYYRSQFEEAWAAFCPEGHTPTQSGNISYMGRHRGHAP